MQYFRAEVKGDDIYWFIIVLSWRIDNSFFAEAVLMCHFHADNCADAGSRDSDVTLGNNLYTF